MLKPKNTEDNVGDKGWIEFMKEKHSAEVDGKNLNGMTELGGCRRRNRATLRDGGDSVTLQEGRVAVTFQEGRDHPASYEGSMDKTREGKRPPPQI